jgi:hypothetical protein
MQNKPNLLNAKMNISPVKTMNYEQLTMNYVNKNKANTKPIQTQYKPNSLDAQMNVSSVLTKDYGNEPPFQTTRKQTQSNPIPPTPIFTSKTHPNIPNQRQFPLLSRSCID